MQESLKNPCNLLQFHEEFSEACMTPFFFGNTQVNLSYLEPMEMISEDICRVSAVLKEVGYELYLERKA